VELVHVEDHASSGLEMYGARRRNNLEGCSSCGPGFIAAVDKGWYFCRKASTEEPRSARAAKEPACRVRGRCRRVL
jgi:hypothetical protein